MKGANNTWQAQLVARHRGLFKTEIDGQNFLPSYPSVGDGSRELLETALGRIGDAVAAPSAGTRTSSQLRKWSALGPSAISLRIVPCPL
jgi:hypothetical protein